MTLKPWSILNRLTLYLRQYCTKLYIAKRYFVEKYLGRTIPDVALLAVGFGFITGLFGPIFLSSNGAVDKMSLEKSVSCDAFSG